MLQDEVLTISEKVVVHVHDLVSWLSPNLEWTWGREVILPPPSASLPPSPSTSSSTLSTATSPSSPSPPLPTSKPSLPAGDEVTGSVAAAASSTTTVDTIDFGVDKKPELIPQVLTDPGIDFTDVEKQEFYDNYECKNLNNNNDDASSFSSISTGVGVGGTGQGVGGKNTRVVVLSYPRYCRYRALLRRLEGSEPSWLCTSVAAALGGFTALPGTRVLFCRDTFDYPDLETHELLCNHLGKNLKKN